MDKFRHFDVKTLAPGTYVRWEHVTLVDEDFDPTDYLFQDEDYRDEDQARLDAFHAGDWHGVGTIARAHIYVIRSGYGTRYTIDSPGIWGTESDSDESHFAELFEDQKADIAADLGTFATIQPYPETRAA